MSIRELTEAGMLLPKDEWGRHDMHTTVNKVAMVGSLLLGLASVVTMYLGGGGMVTIVGAVGFIGFMAWITWISVKAVDAQADQFAEEQEQIAEGETTAPDA